MPKYNEQNIQAGINLALCGIPANTNICIPEVAQHINETAGKLDAFYIWLKLRNQRNTDIHLPVTIGLDQLKTALRLITLIQRDFDTTPGFTDRQLIPLSLFTADAPVSVLPRLLDNTKTPLHDNDQRAQGVYNTCPTTLDAFAVNMLHEINTYVQDHSLAAITLDKAEQQKIQTQLRILNDTEIDADYVRQQGLSEFSPAERERINAKLRAGKQPASFNRALNFTFFGFAFAAFFPWSMLYPAGLAFVNSIANAYVLDKPTRRAYGTRVAEMIPGEGAWQSFARGLLNIPAIAIDTFTATIFETIRILFSYDNWEPINQYNFDRIERGLFNVLFSPFTFAYGAVRGLVEAFKNIYELPATDVTNDDKLNALLDSEQTSPYGLAGLRGLRWVENGFKWLMNIDPADTGFVKGSKYLIRLLIWPIFVLAWAAPRLFGEKTTVDGKTHYQLGAEFIRNVKLLAAFLIALPLTLICLPVDVFAGAFAFGLRALGIDISVKNEKRFHTFVASSWIGFWFSTVIGPLIFMPVMASFLAFPAWVANLLPASFAPHLYLSPTKVFEAINNTMGKGLWNFFWGHDVVVNGVNQGFQQGILGQGWDGFAKGMSNMGSALTSEKAWNKFGDVFIHPTETFKIFTEQAWKVVLYAGAVFGVARGWNESKSKESRAKEGPFLGGIVTGLRGFASLIGLGAVFGIDKPAVQAIANAGPSVENNTKLEMLNRLNPMPAQPENTRAVQQMGNTPNNNNNNNNNVATLSPVLPQRTAANTNTNTNNNNNNNNSFSASKQSVTSGNTSSATSDAIKPLERHPSWSRKK